MKTPSTVATWIKTTNIYLVLHCHVAVEHSNMISMHSDHVVWLDPVTLDSISVMCLFNRVCVPTHQCQLIYVEFDVLCEN